MLTVEEYLPWKWRRYFACGHKMVSPNAKTSLKKRLTFFLWGGERYDTRESTDKVVNQREVQLFVVCKYRKSYNNKHLSLKGLLCVTFLWRCALAASCI